MLLSKKNTELIQIFFSTDVYNKLLFLFLFQRNLAFVESAKMSDKSTKNSICHTVKTQIVYKLGMFQGRASQTLLCIQIMWHLLKYNFWFHGDGAGPETASLTGSQGPCSSVNHTYNSKVPETSSRMSAQVLSAFKFFFYFLNVNIMIW